MDRTPEHEGAPDAPVPRPQVATRAEHARLHAGVDGLVEAGPTESAISRGGQAIEAEGNDLRRASSGNLEGADDESAQQRLRDCQSSLVALGYPLGHGDDPADGITGYFDPTTQEAVRAFQDDNDLDVTGKIDRETYEALMHSFEQAMDMRGKGQLDDGFSYVQADRPMNDGVGGGGDAFADGPLDDSDATLLELQDELDAGTAPSELEDL